MIIDQFGDELYKYIMDVFVVVEFIYIMLDWSNFAQPSFLCVID